MRNDYNNYDYLYPGNSNRKHYKPLGGARKLVDNDIGSIKEWLITLLLLDIPLLNVFIFIYWLFGGGDCKARTNCMRAYFIILMFSTITFFIILAILGISFSELISIFRKVIEANQNQ